jgi:hypothetical protein
MKSSDFCYPLWFQGWILEYGVARPAVDLRTEKEPSENLRAGLAIGPCSAKTTNHLTVALSMLFVVLVHLIVRSETALVA